MNVDTRHQNLTSAIVMVSFLSFAATKEMRTGLFFYVVALHLLVFVTTYNWSHAGGCESFYHDNEHLSHLPPGVQAQMKQQQVQKASSAKKLKPVDAAVSGGK